MSVSFGGGQTVTSASTSGVINSIARAAGGSVNTAFEATPIHRDPSFDGSTSDNIDAAFLGHASGTTWPAIVGSGYVVGPADHIRKLVEITLPGIQNDDEGDTHFTLRTLEIQTSGLEQLRDGRWVEPDGTVLDLLPTGLLAAQIVSGSGDESLGGGRTKRLRYFHRSPGEVTTDSLPVRTI